MVRRVNGIRHAHFIGIGGYGMSAIARVLLDMGIRVTGSDVAENKLIKRLLERGAIVHIGHDASHVEGADLVVYSSSIPEENVERVEAQRGGFPSSIALRCWPGCSTTGLGLPLPGPTAKPPPLR